MINKIMVDIDGVCNCLIMHSLEVNGCNVSRYNDNQWPIKGDYSVTNAVKALRGVTVTAAEFWGNVTRDVWANTPISAEMNIILAHAASLVGRKNVCFLSSPTIDPDCLAGKLEWIQRVAPEWMHRQFLIGPRKHFCAHPNTLLIDDSEDNVDEFHAHGGQAILVPRPWNRRCWEPSYKAIRELARY